MTGTMDYGNDAKTVAKVAALGAVLGLLVVGVAVTITWYWGDWAKVRVGWLPLVIFMPMVCLTLPVALTACFRVRFQDGLVQHVFLKRYVLSQYSYVHFSHVERYPLVIVFRGGRIRWFGAHPAEIDRLANDLQALRDGDLPSWCQP